MTNKTYIYYYQPKTNGVFIKRKANIKKIFNCIKEDTHLDDKLINSFIEQLIECTTNATEPKFDNLRRLIKNFIYYDKDKTDYKYYKFIWNFYNTSFIYLNKMTDEVIF